MGSSQGGALERPHCKRLESHRLGAVHRSRETSTSSDSGGMSTTRHIRPVGGSCGSPDRCSASNALAYVSLPRRPLPRSAEEAEDAVQSSCARFPTLGRGMPTPAGSGAWRFS
jgi:hypothetical protein